MLDTAKLDTAVDAGAVRRRRRDAADAERLGGPQAALLILGLSAFLWAIIFAALDAF